MTAAWKTSLPTSTGVPSSDGRLRTDTVRVADRRVSYATGGRGLPVLFLHGWGLDHRAYQRSLRRLTGRGCRVIAPSMPGFGGSTGLPIGTRSIASYASWVADFVDALEIDEPLVVLGHSFGGGVATKFAHDQPDRVRYLVLMNSVGAARPLVGHMHDSVGLVGSFATAFMPSAEGAAERLVQRVLLRNFLQDPLAVTRAAQLALTADLADEMAALAMRELPVLVLWSDNDSVIPRSAFDTFCSTFAADSEMVSGGHSWLLANPDAFGQVLDNVLHIQNEEHSRRSASTSTAELRTLLAETTMPKSVVTNLLDRASAFWILSAPPAVLATDLTLCHPRLEPDEVRAIARRMTGPNTYRLSVVAHDRPGLMADTASLLATEHIRVESASVMTWSHDQLALHALTVQADHSLTTRRWAEIGNRLRELGSANLVASPYVPFGKVRAIKTGEGDGTSVVRVTAPDRLGILAAICRWFADRGVSVEAANVATIDGQVQDVFLVRGSFDVDALSRDLSVTRAPGLIDMTMKVTKEMARAMFPCAGRLRV